MDSTRPLALTPGPLWVDSGPWGLSLSYQRGRIGKRASLPSGRKQTVQSALLNVIARSSFAQGGQVSEVWPVSGSGRMRMTSCRSPKCAAKSGWADCFGTTTARRPDGLVGRSIDVSSGFSMPQEAAHMAGNHVVIGRLCSVSGRCVARHRTRFHSVSTFFSCSRRQFLSDLVLALGGHRVRMLRVATVTLSETLQL